MVFFFMAAQSRRHDTRPAQITNDLARIVASHNRQAPDVVTHHSRHGVMQDFIREGDNQILRTSFHHGTPIRKLLECPHKIAARSEKKYTW